MTTTRRSTLSRPIFRRNKTQQATGKRRRLFFETLEDRRVLASFAEAGAMLILTLDVASENVAIVSNGTSYTLTGTSNWTGTDSANVTGNGTTTLTVTTAGLAEFDTINILDASVSGTSVTFDDSGVNAYSDHFTITLDDAGAGPITFSGASSFSGSNTLSASTTGGITFSGAASLVTDSGSVSLSAGEAITSGTAATDITTPSVTLVAGSGIGAPANPLTVNATTFTNVETATGGIYVDIQDTGNVLHTVTLASASTSGDIVFTATTGGGTNTYVFDSVTAANGNIDISKSVGGNINVGNLNASATPGKTITVDVGTGGTNGIGHLSGTAMQTNGGPITLVANRMTLGGSSIASGAADVVLRPFTAAEPIQVGGSTAGAALSLLEAGLQTITTGTSNAIVIGDDALATGTISVVGAANLATQNLALRTGNGTSGAISDGTAGVGGNLITAGTLTFNAASGGVDANFNATTLNSASGLDQFLQEAGSVTIGGGGLSAGANDIALAGGIFSLAANDQIDSASTLVVTASGELAIGAFSNTVDTLVISGGSVTGGVGVLTSTSTIDGRSGSSSAILAGGNGLTKTTGGTLTLGATNTYTGNTTVDGGTLLVNGSTAAGSAVSVNSTGTLGGTGTVGGTVSAASGGTVAPGISPGVLETGSATFVSGANFDVEINGTTVDTQYDQLDVTGAVDLGGATLNVSLGFTPAVGNTFIIINNDLVDAVTGTFNSLPEGMVFSVTTGPHSALFQITYQGGSDNNDVVLTALNSAHPSLNGTPGNDTFVVTDDGSNLRLSLNGFEVYVGPQGTPLTLSGLAGNDTLQIDNEDTDQVTANITFHGGTGDDALEILGGTATGIVYTPNAGSGDTARGTIELDGQTITFTGLEPTLVTTGATTVTIDLTSLAAGETVAIKDDGNVGNGISRVEFASASLEDLDFANPSGELIILANGNAFADTINIEGLDSLFDADVTITGGNTDDVNFTGSINLGNNDLTVTNARTITVEAGVAVATTADGAIDLTAARNVLLASGSSLTTVDGGIALLANSGGATSGTFTGIAVTGSGTLIRTTGTGNVSLTSTGGDTGSDNHGIVIDAATVDSTSVAMGAGTITLHGTGKGSGADGVQMDEATISSAGGNISITGVTSGDDGVDIGDSSIVATGSAKITINGTSTGTSSGSDGVGIDDSTISAVDGDIEIVGVTAGGDGVDLDSGTAISSSGMATITIDGTTTGVGSSRHGLEISGSGTSVTSMTGDIEIIGSSSGNHGVWISDAKITSTSTAKITIDGTTTGEGDGVHLEDSGAQIASAGGAIMITGAASGVAAGHGVHLASGVTSAVSATNAATIAIEGNGAGTNAGVRIDSPISSGTGSVTIESVDDDIVFGAAGDVTSTSGTVTVTADTDGGNGGAIGMDANTTIAAGSGNIDLSADGNVTLAGLSTSADVTVGSTSGSILEAGDVTAEITAATAVLNAGNSVGTSGGGNWLDTVVDNLEGSAGAGGFFVWNTDDLEIGGISALVGISTTGGDIEIYVLNGDLTVSETIDSNGGDIELETGVPLSGGDIHINAAVLSGGGDVEVAADGDITFSAAGSIDGETGTPLITLKADDDANSTGGITMTDGSRVDAAGGTIDVDAYDSILLASLETTGAVTVNSSNGSIIDNGD
ncbi:MAG: hypothetical protein KJ000_36210, partial [Pirellulaceae bacterium]|nr:hypothetical protein [Pirellulaceae bacterium]